jgi:large subunit ribosomal protein L11
MSSPAPKKSSSKKAIVGSFKLILEAGKANPSPPVGPAFGQRGLNSKEFCDAFNGKTKTIPGIKIGTRLPVVITFYTDKTYTFEIKQPPATTLIKDELGLAKGSSNPNTQKVGTITRAQLEKLAKMKTPDLTAGSIEAAMRTIAGSAKSMGLIIEGEGA